MHNFRHSSHTIACTPRRVVSLIVLACLSLTLGLWGDWKPASAMDLAREETRTNLAAATFGVSGQGVIVAILDRGIDWKNNDFRNDDGTTRIKYIFDLSNNTGAAAPGNTYGRGTIFTQAQINAALTGGTTLATRDAVGHGTTTTGIAAGNGRNSPNRKYRGIAPNATLIVVKVTSEGAPAHDSEPAEAAFYDPALLLVAMDFVRDKSIELSMPAVMLLNLGTVNGPTDGTSEVARKIDSVVGPGKPGLVFVTGSGDDGGAPNHAGGIVTQGATTSIQIQKGTAGTLRFDLWYPGSDRFVVSIQTPSATFGPYGAPQNNSSSTVQNSSFNYYHLGSSRVFYGATNQKREIFIDLKGPAGTYTVHLQGQTVTNGRFDATLNPSNIFGGKTNRFLNFVVPGSIWDGATAHNNICPNSYVIRTNWIDIDNINRAITNQGSVGELWTGSSTGPTFDGRLGVDVSAPGDNVFTTYNPTSYFATFRFNMIQDGATLYGRASAVSAAAPQVTGIIALMLERNPQLDAAQIKTMLQQSARTDSFTGATPNLNWGYGKVDAHAAVTLAAQSAVAPITPLADTYVVGADANRNTNYGGATEMQVKRTLNPGAGRGRRGFLKFDLSGVTSVTSARLRLFARLSDASLADIPMRIQQVADTSWDEFAMTWNTQPNVATPNALAPDAVLTDATARVYEYDLTSFIQAEIASGRSIVSFRFINMLPTGNSGAFFTAINSREATTGQPQLIVTQ